MSTIILSGNTGWCLEAVFENIKNIESVSLGTYSIGGYDFVKGSKEKLECVKITYNEDLILLDQILDIFFATHNPQLNKWDENECILPMCRSAIIYENEKQKEIVIKKIEQIESKLNEKLETKLLKLDIWLFKEAVEKEKSFYKNNPNDAYSRSNIVPKLEKIRKIFPKLSKK